MVKLIVSSSFVFNWLIGKGERHGYPVSITKIVNVIYLMIIKPLEKV